MNHFVQESNCPPIRIFVNDRRARNVNTNVEMRRIRFVGPMAGPTSTDACCKWRFAGEQENVEIMLFFFGVVFCFILIYSDWCSIVVKV